jgi:hypothetical protein
VLVARALQHLGATQLRQIRRGADEFGIEERILRGRRRVRERNLDREVHGSRVR